MSEQSLLYLLYPPAMVSSRFFRCSWRTHRGAEAQVWTSHIKGKRKNEHSITSDLLFLLNTIIIRWILGTKHFFSPEQSEINTVWEVFSSQHRSCIYTRHVSVRVHVTTHATERHVQSENNHKVFHQIPKNINYTSPEFLFFNKSIK